MSIVPTVPGEYSPDSGKDLPDATTSIEKLPKRFEYEEPPKNGKFIFLEIFEHILVLKCHIFNRKAYKKPGYCWHNTGNSGCSLHYCTSSHVKIWNIGDKRH